MYFILYPIIKAFTKISQRVKPQVVRLSSVHVSDYLSCLHPSLPPPGQTQVRQDDCPQVAGEVGGTGLVEYEGHHT